MLLTISLIRRDLVGVESTLKNLRNHTPLTCIACKALSNTQLYTTQACKKAMYPPLCALHLQACNAVALKMCCALAVYPDYWDKEKSVYACALFRSSKTECQVLDFSRSCESEFCGFVQIQVC